MRPPEFWYKPESSIVPKLLWPAGFAYSLASGIRRTLSKTWHPSVPVICIGNLVVGGSGKTPTAIAVAHYLKKKGLDIHFLSRGYGGTVNSPVRVDPCRHGVQVVGDEPILLAKVAPTWISGNRQATAELAIKAGAEILVMDDGFQNPTIHKDISILVIDGETGFGNGQIIPAGPLREPVTKGLNRANAALIIGNDVHGLSTTLKQPGSSVINVLRGHLAPARSMAELNGKKVFAFAGIGRPKKFFDTLKGIGCSVTGTAEFPDHHIYTVDEISHLVQKANDMSAILVTTSKDRTRLDKTAVDKVTEVPISLQWEDYSALDSLFESILPDLS